LSGRDPICGRSAAPIPNGSITAFAPIGFRQIRERFLAAAAAQRLQIVPRTE
jgi:hypothetical protein